MASERTITPQTSNGGRQNLQAAGFMLAAVLFFSYIPLWIIGSGGAEYPFVFNGMWRLGAVVGCILLLSLGFRPLVFNRQVWREVRAHSIRNWMLLLMTVEGLQFALFAWSTEFIAVPAASVLLELWPLGVIAILAFGHRKEVKDGRNPRYRRNIRSLLLLLSLAFAGVLFVVLSQVNTIGLTFSTYIGTPVSLGWTDFQGISLALLAAMAGSFGAFTLLWGRDLADKLQKNLKETIGNANYTENSLELFGAILGFAVGSFLSVPISLAFGLQSGEGMAHGALKSGLMGGVIVLFPGVYFVRRALLTTDNLGVTALGYGVPVITLGWFWLFSTLGVPLWAEMFSITPAPAWLVTLSKIGVSSVPYLVIGTAAIISANLLINFEAERLLGFKSLVISLWVCGTVVYLRDQFDWWAAWVAKSDGYFDVLVLSATVFALILSFRTARLSGRIQEENDRVVGLFRGIEDLERQGIIGPESEIGEYVLTINEKKGEESEGAYRKARQVIDDRLAQSTGESREQLRTVGIELDRLVYSRQRGTNFGEICAIFLLAAMVVGITLFSRPAEADGLTGFLVELFAMMFPAVILFLGFNVLDLERERRSPVLRHNPETLLHSVAFQDTSRRTVEQWISVVVGLALIAAYAGLFLYK